MHLLRRALIVAGAVLAGCDETPPDNPFVTTGSTGGNAQGSGGGTVVDPELGEPCVEDAQCDDGIDCTSDSCDGTFDRCRYHPEPAPCENGVHCDGTEVCDGKLGCIPGPPFDCGDDNICTIDTCVEESQSCRNDPRDADDDGDPDAHCPPGGDCDDSDPNVSSQAEEVCDNGIDDDCDATTDEDDCASPENDTCVDALLIEASGTYAMSTYGAAAEYPTSCSPPGALRDVVAAVVLPPGPLVDVVARARTATAPVSTALGEQCGDAGAELACGGSFSRPPGGMVSRFRARGLGDPTEETALPLYVTTSGADEIVLDVSIEPATTAPANETCGTAEDLSFGSSIEVEIVDAATDLESACAKLTGELVYRLVLTETSDLDVWGASLDGDGFVSLSLRDTECALLEDEISCHAAATAHVFRHSLPAGDYFLSVAATAPTTIDLVAELSPPTDPPVDEDCDSGAVLDANTTIPIAFDEHQDDILLGCFPAAVDVAYGLTIDQQSDVLLVQRLSAADSASVALAGPGCAPEDLLACGFAGKSPVRARKRNLAAGDYRVVAESIFGLPQELTAFVRPYTPATLVIFADDCDDAVTIPSGGGFFQGNTANQSPSFSAGCDEAGGPPNGAKDQLLKLVLADDKRVVFDMSGSGYETILDVRKGPSCPGVEVPLGCTATIGGSASHLDLELEAGTYFVQVDGLAGASGPWVLDVHVVEP